MEQSYFIAIVYGVLVFELLISLLTMYWLRWRESVISTVKLLVYVIVYIVLLMIIVFVPMPAWLKLTLFTTLSLIMGAMLYQIGNQLSVTVVNLLVIGTIALFSVMSIIGIVLAKLGINLGWMWKYFLGAFVALAIAVCAMLVWSLFVKSEEEKKAFSIVNKVIVAISLVVTSAYITFSTDQILMGNYGDTVGDALLSSIDLYTSFVTVLINLMSLQDS